MTTREQIYDDQIAPLMAQIIALCRDHDIPMLAQYQINDDRQPDDEGDDVLLCTTHLVGGPDDKVFPNTCDHMRKIVARLRPKPAQWGAFVVHGDGTRQQVAGSNMGDGE